MRSLIYFSTESQPFSEDALQQLHEQCVTNNSRLDLTGMLLYKGHNFLQVLEGPEQAVEELYSIIQGDARHKDVVQVVSRPIEHREFGKWEMGFRNLDGIPNQDLPGCTDFRNPFSNDQFRKETHRAHQLLLYFAK